MTAPITMPTIAPVLLESSDDSATVVGTTTAPESVATTVPSVSSGAGVRSAALGGPSVTLIVGAGLSGSGAPGAAISSQGMSPTWQVWRTLKWMSPGAVGAV